LSEK
jgi:hypothetical protein